MTSQTASPEQPADAQSLIIMIGGGGHARVLLDLLEAQGRRVAFITDRNPGAHGQRIGGAEVRGADDLILAYQPEQVLLVNAVGSTSQPYARREVYQRFHARGYRFATLVHPTAIVSRQARLESGVQVMAGAVIQAGARIGENTLINTRASIDHDCVIGAHSHIGPGVTLSGDVQIGDTTHLGTAATVIQGIRIGREVMVGASATVVKNVLDGQRVLGLPARPSMPKAARAATTTAASAAAVPSGEPLTVLLSAAGRRVSLLRLLRQSVEQLGHRPRMLSTDVTRASAAFHEGDVRRVVPRYSDPTCLESILSLCHELSVRVVIPTIDPDLPFYAGNRERFEAIGTRVMVSSTETVRICNDKLLTHEWLVSQGFPTVRQVPLEQFRAPTQGMPFPLLVKPRFGSSSIGVTRAIDPTHIDSRRVEQNLIVQTIAGGKEYTVDVFVDVKGKCHCAVPRMRIETRAGEVSKGMTSRQPAVCALAKQIAEALPGAYGVLNIQIFFDEKTGDLAVIEINPRFGGGYPLSHEAGAPMTRWALEDALGLPSTARDDTWRDGVVMLRFDEAVFVTREQAGM